MTTDRPSPSKVDRASEPRPTPQRPKKWRRVSVDNMGAQMIGTSDGLKDNKVDFNMDTMGGMGPAGMFRDHVEMVDAKNVKAWGEMTMDKGKTWTKVYEMACKK